MWLACVLMALYCAAPTFLHAQTQSTQPTDRPQSSAGSLPFEEAAAGWLRPFDGITTYGWHFTKGRPWRVTTDAALVSPPDAGATAVCMPCFPDYELQMEYQLGPGAAVDVLAGIMPGNLDPSDKTSYAVRLSNSNGVETPWKRLTLRCVPGGMAVFSLDSELKVVNAIRASSGSFGFKNLHGAFAVRRLRLRPVITVRPGLEDARAKLTADPLGWHGFEAVLGGIRIIAPGGSLRTGLKARGALIQADVTIQSGQGSLDLQTGALARSISLDNRIKGIDHTRPVAIGTGGIKGLQNAREVIPIDGQPFVLTASLGPDGSLGVFINGYMVSYAPAGNIQTAGILTLALTVDAPKSVIEIKNLRAALIAAPAR